jgi:hypothetical protein
MMVIDTNLVNSDNHLTKNQLIAMLDGCFTGYANNPDQNAAFRTTLRNNFFQLIDNVQCHCDPDFQSIKPPELVRTLVRILSKRGGKIQQCTPLYAPLRSPESQPIQLTDLIAGSIKTNLVPEADPPLSLKRLYFDERHLSTSDQRRGIYVRAYHWERKVV